MFNNHYFKNLYHWIVSWWYVIKNGFPARKLVVVGVTGTDGKTTTCYLIYEMLKAAGFKTALVSTVATYLGDQEIDMGFHVTNPDAKAIQGLMRKMVKMGYTHLILEVTSHGLDQHRVVGCNFKIGVITNITHEHLDYHGNFANYRETKAKLVRSTQYSVLNEDDPSTPWLKSQIQNPKSQTIIQFSKSKIPIKNPALVGEYNKYNVGAAAAAAKILDVRSQIVEEVVKNFAGVPGRMEEVKLGQSFRVIVDFAHTPNALEQVLKTLNADLVALREQRSTHKKLILVFGCTGLRDPSKRPIMGEIARRLADVVIVTADDPRTEDLGKIFGQITQGKSGFIREDDRAAAINRGVKLAKPGDIVLVAGMGHEKSILIGTVEHPWSDREACEKAIM